MRPTPAKPSTLYLLAFILAFQGLGGLYGGTALVLSPSGSFLEMPSVMLEGSPFNSFLLPGIILLLLLGVLPAILSFALMAQPGWKRVGFLNIYPGIHWAWTYTVYLGIMLVVWILVEILWISYDALQTIFGLVGVVILVLALLPANMRYFGWKSQGSTL